MEAVKGDRRLPAHALGSAHQRRAHLPGDQIRELLSHRRWGWGHDGKNQSLETTAYRVLSPSGTFPAGFWEGTLNVPGEGGHKGRVGLGCRAEKEAATVRPRAVDPRRSPQGRGLPQGGLRRCMAWGSVGCGGSHRTSCHRRERRGLRITSKQERCENQIPGPPFPPGRAPVPSPPPAPPRIQASLSRCLNWNCPTKPVTHEQRGNVRWCQLFPWLGRLSSVITETETLWVHLPAAEPGSRSVFCPHHRWARARLALVLSDAESCTQGWTPDQSAPSASVHSQITFLWKL